MAARTRWALAAATALAVVSCLLVAAAANGYVYWTNNEAATIGRAKLGGSNVNQSFIPVPGAIDLIGLAVDSQHIYWADDQLGTIGRANLDGSGANPSFIGGANFPKALAVDGQYVYWTNGCCAIGRASLDGSGANPSFISGATLPSTTKIGVAVDSQHIYWANLTTGGGGIGTTIGRANLDGSGVTQSFITRAIEPYGVAVDGQHVYWTNRGTDTIGRSNLNGSGADQSFISGASGIFGVAVADQHVYWSNGSAVASSIGRANLNGSGVTQSFITGAGGPVGVAADSLPPPRFFSILAKRLKKKKGIAVLIVGVPGPGRLVLKGKRVKKKAKRAGAAGKVKLFVRAKGRSARKLKRTGKAKVKAKVTYTPLGGEPSTKSTKLTLRRRGS